MKNGLFTRSKTLWKAVMRHLSSEQNGWELSEGVIWGGQVHFGETDLYSLVGQLRYQLQLGLQIACGNPPKISPKKLDKIQRKNLNKIIKHAYENVAYYNQLFKALNLKPDDIQTYNNLQICLKLIQQNTN